MPAFIELLGNHCLTLTTLPKAGWFHSWQAAATAQFSAATTSSVATLSTYCVIKTPFPCRFRNRLEILHRLHIAVRALSRFACSLPFVVLLVPAHAQQPSTFPSAVPTGAISADGSLKINVPHEFSFARLVYDGAGWGDWPRWQADWPEAETHFLAGLNRLTRVDSGAEGVLVDLESDDIFDYPWIYAVEVGALELSREEAARLREYLLRGGFLMVDDFHGIAQWQQFQATIKQVFPNQPIEELDSTQLFSVLFDVGQSLQIPGIRPLMANRTWEYGGTVPRWRVIRDEQQRVMVAINFNMDLGDAWEHADDARYPQRYSALAYRIGTNYVLYALTH